MRRITVSGAGLAGFRSDGYDDHMKLFFPLPGEARPRFALPGDAADPDAPRSPMRDFTPRRFDAQALELGIDFALHATGPASDWARRVQPGDLLGVGVRGSMVVSPAFDWYLLLGDSTALPAIGRRIETAPEGTRLLAVIEVEADERIALPQRANADVQWIVRDAPATGGPRTLVDVARTLALPPGVGHVFGAGEYQAMTAVRRVLAAERGFANVQLRIASYWKRGETAHHENLEAA